MWDLELGLDAHLQNGGVTLCQRMRMRVQFKVWVRKTPRSSVKSQKCASRTYMAKHGGWLHSWVSHPVWRAAASHPESPSAAGQTAESPGSSQNLYTDSGPCTHVTLVNMAAPMPKEVLKWPFIRLHYLTKLLFMNNLFWFSFLEPWQHEMPSKPTGSSVLRPALYYWARDLTLSQVTMSQLHCLLIIKV